MYPTAFSPCFHRFVSPVFEWFLTMYPMVNEPSKFQHKSHGNVVFYPVPIGYNNKISDKKSVKGTWALLLTEAVSIAVKAAWN